MAKEKCPNCGKLTRVIPGEYTCLHCDYRFKQKEEQREVISENSSKRMDNSTIYFPEEDGLTMMPQEKRSKQLFLQNLSNFILKIC